MGRDGGGGGSHWSSLQGLRKNWQLVMFLSSKCVLPPAFFLWHRGLEMGGWVTYIARAGGWVHRTWTGFGRGEREAHMTRGGLWLDGRTGGSPWPIEAVASLLPRPMPCGRPHGRWAWREGHELAGCVAASRSVLPRALYLRWHVCSIGPVGGSEGVYDSRRLIFTSFITIVLKYNKDFSYALGLIFMYVHN